MPAFHVRTASSKQMLQCAVFENEISDDQQIICSATIGLCSEMVVMVSLAAGSVYSDVLFQFFLDYPGHISDPPLLTMLRYTLFISSNKLLKTKLSEIELTPSTEND